MKIAVFIPDGCPLSMKIVAEAIMVRLEARGFSFIRFKRNQTIPQNVDLYWDPRSGGGQNPYRKLKKIDKPLVVTVHGLALFSMPLKELYDGRSERTLARKNKLKYKIGWKLMKKKVSKIITVSNHGKAEVLEHLSFSDNQVVPIQNGYDENIFTKADSKVELNGGKPYFLTVISYQKKKNFERMLAAYKQIPESDDKPDFIALVKPYDQKPNIKGLQIITDKLDIEQIVNYYRNALALVFPTLHEGFGLPIIEAMACGCPVITSDVTACPEVAGDAALLVNPRSVEAIKNAMIEIIKQPVRDRLAPLMEERITKFGWDRCADEYQAVFESLKSEV